MKTPKTDILIKTFEELLTTNVKQAIGGHSNTGTLQNSIKISHSKESGGYELSIDWEDYGEFVDEGRKPGKGVPVDALKKWIKTRGLSLDGDKKSTRSQEAKINSLAYVINMKIKREGIKPTYFLSNTLDDMMPKFADDVASSIGDDIVDDLFNDIS